MFKDYHNPLKYIIIFLLFLICVVSVGLYYLFQTPSETEMILTYRGRGSITANGNTDYYIQFEEFEDFRHYRPVYIDNHRYHTIIWPAVNIPADKRKFIVTISGNISNQTSKLTITKISNSPLIFYGEMEIK